MTPSSTTRWLLTWVLLAPAAAWAAPAGVMQFAAGPVQVQRGQDAQPGRKGLELQAQDIVSTGAQGQAQIRFSDGGLVAVYANSEFALASYADTGEPTSDQFAAKLLSGGLRAITGLIGKRDPKNYKITTPTAVVGIRGSAFRIAIAPNGVVTVAGEQDSIEVCTDAGCVGLRAGEVAQVDGSSGWPLRSNTLPEVPQPSLPPSYEARELGEMGVFPTQLTNGVSGQNGFGSSAIPGQEGGVSGG